jgi:hypothetical protein
MNLVFTEVPFWLSLLFIFCFLGVLWFLAQTVRDAYLATGQTVLLADRMRRKVLFFYASFFVLVSCFSLGGYFSQNTLPPRILVAAAAPLLSFYFIFWAQRGSLIQTLWQAPLYLLVRIHLFRLVGLFFFLAYAYEALPWQFAFVGGSGDLLTALLAIPVIYLLKKQHRAAKISTLIWSIIGLADIVSVLITAVKTTQHALANGTEGIAQLGTFPFSWIPAFAPATIVFLHFFILVKLGKKGAN